ncbi:tripartite tricarboxylate transporter substrate binding protein [Cupriavidus necator]|uniref:Tripartite tricarboxylate transporter substrate binding protein n=1 Tax=Cupriavidus necator TaxID=106590 RepID=A0A367PCF7_CUPNE|nr:tripartite tricarboxylate transporter substrate binding protein [Cupriavidus necator]QQX88114.1 tripartite tricarboxylate transporter substrate binding protein [Cupriavidus necator]RCJ05562.1 tripartite tricarboxylate transporter substrate binding protein [Cupriavidus necator]
MPQAMHPVPTELPGNTRRRDVLRGLTALGLGAAAGPLCASNAWPARPIRLVVPAPPGGGTDLFARTLAASLGKALGQTIVVDNKPGATGIIGNDTVAKASPDGYTLLFTYAATVVINQTLQPRLPYDGLRDLLPVAQVGAGGNFLVVTPDFPARTLKEFVAHVLKRPDAYDYGSWGIGSGGHLTMEALKMQTGMKLRHVPYKGVAQILTDMQGGVVKVAFVDTSSSLPLIRAGKLRALAISGTRRAPATPDIPTMTEQGYPFDADSWYGLFAPAGTSAAIVQRLNTEVARLLADAPMRERFLQLNMGMAPARSAEQFAQTVRGDVGVWGKVITANHITVD